MTFNSSTSNSSQPTLRALRVSLAKPDAILGELENAIAGLAHYVPVPADDPDRARLLQSSQRVGEPIDDSIALVVPTSGSTGTPKGAQLSAVNLVASADATHQALGGPGHWLSALPAYHIAGIQVLVRSLVAGTRPVCLDLSSGFSVSDFARASRQLAQEAGDEHLYTALTPQLLAKTMETLEGIEALRRFDAILVGGGELNPQLAKSASELRIHLVATYGSAETAGGCVYDGLPLSTTQVEVRDGRVYLGGATIAQGYRNAPEHEAFRQPGWFASSDGGRIDNGKLVITGRLDAMIVTGGLKIHPEVIERELLAVPGVGAACVVGIPHPRFGQAVVAAFEGSASVGDIFDHLGHLPRWQIPKDLRHLDALPRTSLGKIHRARVAELF